MFDPSWEDIELLAKYLFENEDAENKNDDDISWDQAVVEWPYVCELYRDRARTVIQGLNILLAS